MDWLERPRPVLCMFKRVIKNMRKWSKEQQELFDYIENEDGDALVDAVAGSGKTTTIVEACKRLPEDLDSIFVAFNNHIVNELKDRMPDMNVSTLHSFGWRMLRRHYRGAPLNVSKEKIYTITEKLINGWEIPTKQRKAYMYKITKLVDLIRLTLSETEEEIIELADKHDFTLLGKEAQHCQQVIEISDEDEVNFDFVDMIYRVVTNDSVKVAKYDVVFVDEAQDLSKSQQVLVNRMRKKTGRRVIVGDPNQAIYGFAGSDVESFQRYRDLPNITEFSLPVCYRCPKTVVRLAQDIVPHIKPHKDNIEGVVRNGLSNELKQGDWVLCRNTKPLVKLCLQLIKSKRKANVKGRDYGTDLVGLLKRTKTDNVIVAGIKLDNEVEKLYRKLKRFGVAEPDTTNVMINLREKVEIIKELVFEEVKNVTAGIKLIESIFKDDVKQITLSTIHKSKGFENDRIFVLRRDLIPSKFAIDEWQKTQESNLLYVMYTRTKKELVFITDILN